MTLADLGRCVGLKIMNPLGVTRAGFVAVVGHDGGGKHDDVMGRIDLVGLGRGCCLE